MDFMPLPDEPPTPHRGLKFVPEITAGNLLQVIALVALVMVWCLRLESRVDVETKVREEQHENTMERFRLTDIQHKSDLEHIDHRLDQIESLITSKADKPR